MRFFLTLPNLYILPSYLFCVVSVLTLLSLFGFYLMLTVFIVSFDDSLISGLWLFCAWLFFWLCSPAFWALLFFCGWCCLSNCTVFEETCLFSGLFCALRLFRFELYSAWLPRCFDVSLDWPLVPLPLFLLHTDLVLQGQSFILSWLSCYRLLVFPWACIGSMAHLPVLSHWHDCNSSVIAPRVGRFRASIELATWCLLATLLLLLCCLLVSLLAKNEFKCIHWYWCFCGYWVGRWFRWLDPGWALLCGSVLQCVVIVAICARFMFWAALS